MTSKEPLSYGERLRLSQVARLKREGQSVRVPKGPSFDRIAELERHITLIEIAKRVNIPLCTIHTIRYRGREGKITREYERRLLAYELPADSTTYEERIIGARRIYRGLAVRGWNMMTVSDAIGMDHKGFRNVVCDSPNLKRGFSKTAYAELKRVAAKLETQNPIDVLNERSVATTIGKARSAGWVDIMAWDMDTIHRADARPNITGECGQMAGALIHLRESQGLCEACQDNADRGYSSVSAAALFAAWQAGGTRASMSERFGVSLYVISKYVSILDGGVEKHIVTDRNLVTMRGNCSVCGRGVQVYSSGKSVQCADVVRSYRQKNGHNHGGGRVS